MFATVVLTAGCTSRGKANMDLLRSPNPMERRRGVQILGESEDPATATSLAPVFRADPDLDVRIEAAEALGRLGGPQATALLLEKASSQDASLVRVAALGALEKCRDPAAAPGLIDLWRKSRGPDDGVAHIGAARALVKIGAPAVPPLLAALGDGSPTVRTFALEVLGQVGDRSIEDRIAPLTRDPDGMVREGATSAMARIEKRGSAR